MRYSATNAVFSSEKKGTFMEQFLDMSNEERLKIIKFYDENSIDFGIPGIEEKASALFLEAISLDEWKNRVKELSSQSPVKNTLQYIKNEFQQDAKNSALSKRNNPMIIQKYSGEKSKNMSVKNEILKAFFEEFLKNNNPLALLEIIKKRI
ncbi:hypothetical protein V2I29_07300 [Campylobacter sp. CX2-8023-23]|uniref:hypothetical protein n=1 Tax=Campylobacter porcelli TaxID=1660073 RepID=UPI002EA80DF4|nr:hypothetical protein [Campylobacter sp. CX2-8023-23]